MIALNKENQDKKIDLENQQTNLNEGKKSKNSTKFEDIVEFFFLKFSSALRIIGPLFAFCLIVFVIVVSKTVFYLIIPYWIKNIHQIFGVILFFLGIYLLFSILFNYLLAVLVKPGSMDDIKKSNFYRKNDPLKIKNTQINFEDSKLAENIKKFTDDKNNKSKNNLNTNIKLRFKTEEANSSFNTKFDTNEDLEFLEKNSKANSTESKIYILYKRKFGVEEN